MAARLSQKARDELLAITKSERQQERCVIAKGLHAEGKELTKQYDDAIDDVDSRIQVLKDQIAVLNEEKDVYKTDKNDALNAAKLANFEKPHSSKYSDDKCAADYLHEDLIAHDLETNRQLKEILQL